MKTSRLFWRRSIAILGSILSFCVLLFSVSVHAGQVVGSGSSLTFLSQGNQDPSVARPQSRAGGKSLDEWMEAYIRWLEDGANPQHREKNVAFLPIIGELGIPFEVTVKSGTKLLLPATLFLGETYPDNTPDDEPLDDAWWGDRSRIFADVCIGLESDEVSIDTDGTCINGKKILDPNEDYYVGPTDLNPPASLLGSTFIFYQAIVGLINPLPPGKHKIVLHSEFVDSGAMFDNTWIITVTPGRR